MLCAKLHAVRRGLLYKSYCMLPMRYNMCARPGITSGNTAGLHPQNHREGVIKNISSRWRDVQHRMCMFAYFWTKCANVCACMWMLAHFQKSSAGIWVCIMQAIWPCYCLICAIIQALCGLVSTSGASPGPLLAPQLGHVKSEWLHVGVVVKALSLVTMSTPYWPETKPHHT